MAVTSRDRHGNVTKARIARASGAKPVDARTRRWYAVVDNAWSEAQSTKTDAEAVEAEMKQRQRSGARPTGSTMTLGQFLDEVWLGMIDGKVTRGEIKRSTAEHYRIMSNAYLRPALGDVRLRDLKPDRLRKFYAELAARPLSPRSVRNVHRALTNALGLAVADGYVITNAAKGRDVAPRGRVESELRAWTPEQVRAFLAYVADDRLFALWRLACTTGMRRGEVLGLRWSAIDLEAGRLTVERALLKSPTNEVRFETPKSARSRRTIDIDVATVAALRAHRKRQAAEQLASLGAWPTEGDAAGRVFTDEAGQPIKPDRVYEQFVRRAKAAELPVVRFHDLRHTAATLMLRAGVPVHVVSERLGHASASITMDVYAHVLRDQSTDAADRLAAAIDG